MNIVCGCKPWSQQVYEEKIRQLPGDWRYVVDGKELQLALESLQLPPPRYIFFLHWSRIVPREILERYECVCFHMTDVPYGRGGSPLQNLIARGRHETRLTALRMTDELDAGPVYCKRRLSLQGTAEEIYLRAGKLAAQMIRDIITSEPEPQPQQGEPVVFKRRKPEQSLIPTMPRLEDLFDFVRMLDADGYPHAFIWDRGFRYEFSHPVLRSGRIEARVVIRKGKP